MPLTTLQNNPQSSKLSILSTTRQFHQCQKIDPRRVEYSAPEQQEGFQDVMKLIKAPVHISTFDQTEE